MYYTGKGNGEFNETVYYTVIGGYCIEFIIYEEIDSIVEIDILVDGDTEDNTSIPAGVRAGIFKWMLRTFKTVIKDLKEGLSIEVEPYDDHHKDTRIKWLEYLGFTHQGNGNYTYVK